MPISSVASGSRLKPFLQKQMKTRVRDLKDVDLYSITPAHCTASLLWLSSTSRKGMWDLSEKEQCVLLGGWDIGLYKQKMSCCLSGGLVELDEDRIIRLSLLLKLHRLLDYICPHKMDSSVLFNRMNNGDFLRSISIREYLLKDASLERFLKLMDYLEMLPVDQYS